MVAIFVPDDIDHLLRVTLEGDLDDGEMIAGFEMVLRDRPEVRAWQTLVDMREYNGTITWRGAMRMADIRGPAEPGPANRTAVVCQPERYEDLFGGIDAAYAIMIKRRVRLFETEEAALAWLREP